MDKIILLVICILFIRFTESSDSLKFDGTIIFRTEKKVKCKFNSRFNAIRKTGAQIFAKNKIVYLPGTNESIINEWIKIGEILLTPSSSEINDGLIIFESSPLAVQRGCKIILLPNRPPVFGSIQAPKIKVQPESKVFIKTSIFDPENDSFYIHWKSSKGNWLNKKTRKHYNFFITPYMEGETVLTIEAVDTYGAKTTKNITLYIGNSEGKDLYHLKQTFLHDSSNNAMDAVSDKDGNILILEKNGVKIFSPQGIMNAHFKGPFKNASKIQVDNQNYLYVLDASAKKIFKMNRDGKVLSIYKDLSKEGDVIEIQNPVDFSIAKNNYVYMLDQTLSRILIFNDKADLIGAIGAKGSKDGQLNLPQAIATGYDDALYVLDGKDLKIKIFNKKYQFIKSITLSERFNYSDLILDPFTQTLFVVGNLKSKSTRTGGYIISYNLQNGKTKNHSLQGIGKNGIQTASLDLEGNLIITTQKPGPILLISSLGVLKSQFLMEKPSRSSLISAGPLGTIYFQSGKGIKRINYSGCIDRYFPNDGNIADICVDAHENLYLINKNSNNIRIFNPTGQHIKDIAVPLKSREKIIGIGVNKNQEIFVLKTPFTLLHFSKDGNILNKIDMNTIQFLKTNPEEKTFIPSDFYVDRDSSIYIVDKSRKTVYVFKNNCTENSILKRDFKKIADISVDLYGNVYILDSVKKSVFKYSSNGGLKREIDVSKNIKKPVHLATFGDGTILVFDDSSKRIFLYK